MYRRDYEPHRGDALSLLGTTSILLGLSGFITMGATGIVGLPFGLYLMILAQRDLTKMRKGEMDPHGEWLTNAAWHQGCYGSLVSLITLMLGPIVLSSWLSGRWWASGGFIHALIQP